MLHPSQGLFLLGPSAGLASDGIHLNLNCISVSKEMAPICLQIRFMAAFEERPFVKASTQDIESVRITCFLLWFFTDLLKCRQTQTRLRPSRTGMDSWRCQGALSIFPNHYQ